MPCHNHNTMYFHIFKSTKQLFVVVKILEKKYVGFLPNLPLLYTIHVKYIWYQQIENLGKKKVPKLYQFLNPLIISTKF